jgi:glycine oxidase
LTRPDAAVVGAGAIGTACAYELAGAGLRVMVIERAEPGAEASGASAGILSVPGVSRPDPLALLARESRALYEPLAAALREEAEIDVGLGRNGHLHLCMTEGEARQARRVAADPAERREGTSFMAADELRRLEPTVSPAALDALHLPRSSWVDDVRLVRAFVRAAVIRCPRVRDATRPISSSHRLPDVGDDRDRVRGGGGGPRGGGARHGPAPD